MAILISILVVIGLAIGFFFALFKYKNRPLQPDYYEYFKTQDTVPVGKVGIFATALIMPENHSHAAKGDWFAIWADDGLTIDATYPCTPHDIGTDQRPLEVHQIHYLDGTTIYSADPIVDKMSIQPKLAKLPMLKNIVVEGGYVDHVNANQSDYAKFLRFHCCENVDVRSITSTRNMTGAIEFYHSAKSLSVIAT